VVPTAIIEARKCVCLQLNLDVMLSAVVEKAQLRAVPMTREMTTPIMVKHVDGRSVNVSAE
jgi:hypothetical protein